MAHGDAREGKWRGNWRMEWVASTLHTTSEYGVSSITTANAHTSATSSQLNWRPPPRADLNGLVRFAERRNLFSAHVPSYFKRGLQQGVFVLSVLRLRSRLGYCNRTTFPFSQPNPRLYRIKKNGRTDYVTTEKYCEWSKVIRRRQQYNEQEFREV
jgi:hypothetical protein